MTAHKETCEWPACPGDEACEGLSLLSEKTITLTPPTWLGHRDGCSVQWSNVCDCDPDAPVEFPEERPDDDPAPIPTCDGRYCGGRPHE